MVIKVRKKIKRPRHTSTQAAGCDDMRSLGRNDNLGDLDMENLYSWEILGKIVADIIVVKFCLVSKQYIELWLEMTLPETHSQFAHENGWDWKIKSPFLFWFRPIFRDELLVLGRVS